MGIDDQTQLKERVETVVSRVSTRHVELLFLTLLLIGVVYQVVRGFDYPRLAGHFPVVVGVPTVLMILYVFRDRFPASDETVDLDSEEVQDRLLLVQGFAWVLLLFSLVIGLGLTVGCTVFLVLYYRLKRQFGWTRLVIYVSLFLAFVILVFQLVLQIPLYGGIFGIPQGIPM
jgi:hypothetical protein